MPYSPVYHYGAVDHGLSRLTATLESVLRSATAILKQSMTLAVVARALVVRDVAGGAGHSDCARAVALA